MDGPYIGMFSARIDYDLGMRVLKIITHRGCKKSEYIREALESYTKEKEENIKANLESLKEWEK